MAAIIKADLFMIRHSRHGRVNLRAVISAAHVPASRDWWLGLRQLGYRVLAIGAQFVLVALQALLQFLAGLAAAQVRGVRFARPGDGTVFFLPCLSETGHNQGSEQREI
jgi:hypothetical protein